MFDRFVPVQRRSRVPERTSNLFDLFDDMFARSIPARLSSGGEGFSFASGPMPMDVVENEDAYEVHAELPGFEAKDVDVTVEGDVLSIKAERVVEHSEESPGGKDGESGERYLRRERRMGSQMRSLRLPAPVAEDKIEAKFDKGVLHITLPKSEELKPRRISIN